MMRRIAPSCSSRSLKEDKVKRTAAREVLDRVFGGNVGSLVAHLLKGERLSRDELDELHRLIDQHRKELKGGASDDMAMARGRLVEPRPAWC